MNNERFEELRKNYLPRFWDTENNVMVYPEFEDTKVCIRIFYKIFIDNIKCEYDIGRMLLEYPRFIPMRPTGFIDNKNNPIYESDILEGVAYKEPRAMKTRRLANYVVIWNCQLASFDIKSIDEKYRYWGHNCFNTHNPKDKQIRTFDVIGNIHETKEVE